jgi:hypothetical protein
VSCLQSLIFGKFARPVGSGWQVTENPVLQDVRPEACEESSTGDRGEEDLGVFAQGSCSKKAILFFGGPSYFGVHFTSIRSHPGNPPGPGAGFSTTSIECMGSGAIHWPLPHVPA